MSSIEIGRLVWFIINVYSAIIAETSPLSINRRAGAEAVAGSAVSTDSVGVVAHATDVQDLEQLSVQLQVEDQVRPPH